MLLTLLHAYLSPLMFLPVCRLGLTDQSWKRVTPIAQSSLTTQRPRFQLEVSFQISFLLQLLKGQAFILAREVPFNHGWIKVRLTKFLVGFLRVCCFWFTIFPDLKPRQDLQVSNHHLPIRYFYYDLLPSFYQQLLQVFSSLPTVSLFCVCIGSHPHLQHLRLCTCVYPPYLAPTCLAHKRSFVIFVEWLPVYQAQYLAHVIFLTHNPT